MKLETIRNLHKIKIPQINKKMDKTVILINWSKMATSTYSSKVEVQLLPHPKKKKKKREVEV